ncbi:hypothetical protein AMJ52_07855 [candidate division TA06 bacterium DG_78]|uniref:Uncharacterized protein n=1 Tax=candidate division TA06 bacterium DG_78 TaxID=1703772 RepID=A0A0S7YD27_UNCT6|nr:MAG: hypothetical protein AMJ52_07855 [candidate division TA06 bacterium DG_78]
MKNLLALLIPRIPLAAYPDQVTCIQGKRFKAFVQGDTVVHTLLTPAKVPLCNKLYVNENGQLDLDTPPITDPPDYYFFVLNTFLRRR